MQISGNLSQKNDTKNWKNWLDLINRIEIIVEAIKDLPIAEQAELIADKFAAVSQKYDKLELNDINVPEFYTDEIPIFLESDIGENGYYQIKCW